MPDALVGDLARQAIFVTLQVGLPVMIVALGVGLVISLLQAITSIQEQTLTFVPKIVGILLTMLVAMPFMLAALLQFTQSVFATIGGPN